MYPDQESHSKLSVLAYQSWLDRGQPLDSPEIDWAVAEQKFAAQRLLDTDPSTKSEVEHGEHSIATRQRNRRNDQPNPGIG